MMWNLDQYFLILTGSSFSAAKTRHDTRQNAQKNLQSFEYKQCLSLKHNQKFRLKHRKHYESFTKLPLSKGLSPLNKGIASSYTEWTSLRLAFQLQQGEEIFQEITLKYPINLFKGENLVPLLIEIQIQQNL
ncbi:hypothetical protein ABPG74_007053 [Tetrahymena malaccensis]